ncbi:stage II sporulation protein M [Actinoplanes sp. GCM10030250]|uniref:stage II sporulation protein M n=1 Tax=Actinoplanes sp. GCM10030250 TaxID=3273376 RepID=UPI0036164C22
MDLDAYVLERAGEWDRMEELARRRRLTAGEADELVILYQRATTHLSVIRSRLPDPVVIADLSRQLMAGRAAITRGRRFDWRTVGHFLTDGFPLALYEARRWWISLALLLLALTTALILYIADDPAIAELFLSQSQIDRLVASDFVGYYSEYQAQNFAAQVWTNNALLTAQCIAAGVLIVPVVYLLGSNMFNVGLTGGVMVDAGAGSTFLSYLAPHGLLELTCVFIGAGVGLRIGWAWIAPGPFRTRRQALASRARTGMVVAVGLVPTLLVAGLLEAYVTPAPVPTAVKIAVGATVWLLFLAYALIQGRAAHTRRTLDSTYDLPTA